jgi:hypothetical protein
VNLELFDRMLWLALEGVDETAGEAPAGAVRTLLRHADAHDALLLRRRPAPSAGFYYMLNGKSRSL